LSYIAKQKEVKRDRMGCMGFCMSGPYVIYAAARHPELIAAGAVMHGTSLVTGKADSPDEVAATVKASLYFVFGGDDKYVLPDVVNTIRTKLSAKTDSKVEVYPNMQHGWGFPSRYSYNAVAAERLWQSLDAYFRSRLT